MSSTITPASFITKWRGTDLSERSAAQQHFIDLCYLLGVPTPAGADREGTFYTFEKGASKATGGRGFADVWYRDHFAWEYKRSGGRLEDAYAQLSLYKEALESPPLLIVSDLQTIRIYTSFTNTVQQIHEITIDELDSPDNLRLLRWVFTDPERLRPQRTPAQVTEEAAERFAKITLGLRSRGHDPDKTAHFMVQLLFCLFAEDVGLLPNRIFSRLVKFSAANPAHFTSQIGDLLQAMRAGGISNLETISRFNGGLFNEIHVLELTEPELRELERASRLDWSYIEPAIIGTLFERSLDPARRSQLGAHYTGRADIERVVEPVVMTPLRRRWAEVRGQADELKAAWDDDSLGPRARENRKNELASLLFTFQEELAAVRILDPACGSGNFLYVALENLLDLEKQVAQYAAINGLPFLLPRVLPTQLYGLEINHYARELTQTVIWMGYLQWMRLNAHPVSDDPVLDPMETITLQDSILDLSDPDNPREPEWPEADFIIGNPPFLGAKRLRSELGDDYVPTLFAVYDGRLPNFSDLCCYFFEVARRQIERGLAKRAGLLATNSIRGGSNRETLNRIKETGDIFMAWADEPWILDGAAVRISIIGFDEGTETEKVLNGLPVKEIFSDLTAEIDIGAARPLPENQGIAFQGVVRSGPFNINAELAEKLLNQPVNPNDRPNSDVIKPLANGADIVRRNRGFWIIDFGVDMPEHEAAMYELPFEYLREHVKPKRMTSRSQLRKLPWWLPLWPRPVMREALAGLSRYVATPLVAKHRVFAWLEAKVIPDHALGVFARSDDYFFGVLHSKAHEIWSLRMGTWLGKGNDPRYTPTTCFETFPFPWPPGQEPADDSRVGAIAEAARELNDLRERWLNPEDASEAELKKRTLTNLYNQRPTWLANAHRKLDRAVLTAYGWQDLIPTLVDSSFVIPTEREGPPPSPVTDPDVIPSSSSPVILSDSEESSPVTRNPFPVTESANPVIDNPSPDEELLARLLALNLERADQCSKD